MYGALGVRAAHEEQGSSTHISTMKKTHCMSIYSAKHVSPQPFGCGRMRSLLYPLCHNGSTRHDALCRAKTATLNANQAEDNQEAQGAASTITMKAQL